MTRAGRHWANAARTESALFGPTTFERVCFSVCCCSPHFPLGGVLEHTTLIPSSSLCYLLFPILSCFFSRFTSIPTLGGSPYAIYLTTLLSPASFDCPSPCVPVSLLSSLLLVARSLCYSTHSMIAKPLLSKLVFCSTLTLASLGSRHSYPGARPGSVAAQSLQANWRFIPYCGQSSRLMHP